MRYEFRIRNYESQASNIVSYDSRRRRRGRKIREEISPTTQVQPSTSSAVLVKKRGRPADSPGTKLRKASEKALLKKSVAKKAKNMN